MTRNFCNSIAMPVLLYTAIFSFLTACSSKTTVVESKPEKFQVTNPTVLDTVYTKEYVAEIQSVQNVELRARVKGFIEKIYVDEGKPVKAGQVLFTLSSREFKEELLKANAQLKSAIAELKSAQVELKNTKLLVEESIVSKSELETIQAKMEAIHAKMDESKSSIALANLNLSFAQVRAPFSGVINRIPNKVGSIVEEGALLTTISNNKEVFAYFNVPEKEYLDFVRRNEMGKQGKVSLLLADGEPFSQSGTIETTDNEIDKSSGNMSFRARFANPQMLLKHGSSAKLLMNTELKNALIIPQKCTFEVQDKINVYVVDTNNIVRIKSFIPKLRLPNLYVVESGLSTNDKIIYEGVQLVKEGEKIIPEMVQFNNVAGQLAKQ